MRRRRMVGIVVLVGACALAAALWQRPDPWSDQLSIRADVTDASGLAAIGADVRVAGVPVGRVSDIARHGQLARLILTVSPAIGTVHRDATVSLHPRLMFEGTAYVELTLGTPAAPTLGNRVIPRAQTSTYVPLADAMSILQASARADVRAITSAGATMLSTSAPPELRGTIAASPQLVGDAGTVADAARGPHRTELRNAVSSLGRVASAVAEQSPGLGTSLRASSALARAANADGGAPLAASVATLPRVATDLRAGAGAADGILTQLGSLAPRLRPGVRALGPTLDAVRPVLRRAPSIERSFKPVIADAGTFVAGARTGSAPALAAVHAMSPPLQTYQGTLLGALERPTDLGTPAYLAFLGLFAGGGGASRPFGVDGNGHFMRFGLRFLTGVGLPLPPCTLIAKVLPPLGTTLAGAGACTP